MNPTAIDLDSLLKRLHLANTRRIWRDLIVRAETEQWSFHAFLTVLVTEEVAHRQQTRLGRLSRRAEFPFLKTIDDFDFTFQSTLRLALLGSALAPDFVTEGRCLILHAARYCATARSCSSKPTAVSCNSWVVARRCRRRLDRSRYG